MKNDILFEEHLSNKEQFQMFIENFKRSRKIFGLTHIKENNKFIFINEMNEIIEIKDKKEVEKRLEKFKDQKEKRCEAEVRFNADEVHHLPREVLENCEKIKKCFSNSIFIKNPMFFQVDPSGGLWCNVDTEKLIQTRPIYCSTFRFDLEIPIVYYMHHKINSKKDIPVKECAFFGYLFAGLVEKKLDSIFYVPTQYKYKSNLNVEKVSNMTDLFEAEKILNKIEWNDDEPYVISINNKHSLFLFKDSKKINTFINNFNF